MWMEDHVLKNVPQSATTVAAKARILFKGIKVNLSDPKVKFVASNGWFHIFEAH
jgi:hypothetical protein